MPKAFAWILTAVTVVVLALFGLAIGITLVTADRPAGALDTDLEGVTVEQGSAQPAAPTPPPEPVSEGPCWPAFGGDPQRSLARPTFDLGLPKRKYEWTRVLDDYMEFPPSYCDGMLYVNTLRGHTWAIEAATGKVRWKRKVEGSKPSTPAIDGARLLIASKAGTLTAVDRSRGRQFWQLHVSSAIESSPVVVDGVAYFGAQDGRLFAVFAKSGRVRWAYDTGGRINASPSVYGDRVCITTYAGSIFCLEGANGREDLEHIRAA